MSNLKFHLIAVLVGGVATCSGTNVAMAGDAADILNAVGNLVGGIAHGNDHHHPHHGHGPVVVVNRPKPRPNHLPSNAVPISEDGGIVVLNPPETGGLVNFAVNGKNHTLQSGYKLTFPNLRRTIIAFQSGGANGRIVYRLSPNETYRFTVGPAGWGLVKTKPVAEPVAVPIDAP